jgi:hypothetical protein
MYDDITCEYALPGELKPKSVNFQTKDFDCLLDHYVITKAGRLTKNSAAVHFHGMLRFHTFTADNMWFEYEANFADARLIKIEPISIYRNSADGPPDVFFPRPDRPIASENGALGGKAPTMRYLPAPRDK